jgi:hypothetical protein
MGNFVSLLPKLLTMLRQEDIEYCTKQKAAVESITADDITSVFNRFTTLYAMYNRLYNRLPEVLIGLGQQLPAKDDDNKRSTVYVTQYLGGATILGNLSAQHLDNDIKFLTWILEYGAFHLKLKNGKHVPKRDAELARDIKSADPNTRVIAILYIAYYVRCNMLHGEKHQEENQRRLVSAATRIIGVVTNHLYDKLDAAMALAEPQ